MHTKLILIEGLPGSGKSTTAQLVHEILTENNLRAQLFLEGNLDHPADYDGVAYLDEVEYDDLLSDYEEFRDLLSPYTWNQENSYFVEYRKLINEHCSSIPNEMLDTLVKHDVYELPLDRNRELITAKWKQFAERALNGADLYIFDCCFIQNPVTMGMIKHDAAKEDITNYVVELAAISEALNPLLIYVDQNDLEYSFGKAFEERPQEWSEGFVDYYTKQGFGKKQGYTGLEGTLQVLKARRDLEESILSSLNMAKRKVNNSSYDLDAYRQVLVKVLSGIN
ncbi:hypothetical protein MKZ24_30895 [Paenibacillus sp. FSL R7-0297]|uniref:hypothetical protein n=1 Tax=unclassified Paenibacillus TaxID=185978 RepID=UPI0030F509DC